MGKEREYHLGWSLTALAERLKAAESPDRLAVEYAWMQAQIAAALDDVETSQLVEPGELDAPSPETIAKLRRRAQAFNRLRDEVLQEPHKGSDGPIFAAVGKPTTPSRRFPTKCCFWKAKPPLTP